MYVPGIFHGVRFVENERHTDRHECFLLDVFHHEKPHECFLLGGVVGCFCMNVLPNRERIA